MDFFEDYGHQKYLILELNMRFACYKGTIY